MAQQQSHQKSADTPIAVKEGMDGLELYVGEANAQ